MRDFMDNSTAIFGTDDDGDDFHTTALSERFYGEAGFDAIMTGFRPEGTLADLPYSADFFFGGNLDNDRWNGFETKTIAPDYDMVFGGIFSGATFNANDPTNLTLSNGQRIDVGNTFSGLVYFASDVAFDEYGSVDTEIQSFQDYGVIVSNTLYSRADAENALEGGSMADRSMATTSTQLKLCLLNQVQTGLLSTLITLHSEPAALTLAFLATAFTRYSIHTRIRITL